jgi:hypothetical protein
MTASTHPSNSGLGLAIATLLAIIATLIVNTLSNIFPPGGLNVGAIANTLLKDVLILPANYAFAIWGLIYVGLVAYGLYQLRPSQRRDPKIRQVNSLLIVACLAQVAWIYLFTLRQFWWSVVAMLAILLPLIGAYLHLRTGKERVSRDRKWLAQIPFSVYLAWISVATIVNIACALYNSGWNGWGLSAIAWTVIMLVIGAIVAGLVVWQRRDQAFGLVFIWAYLAIALRQSAITAIWLTAVGLGLAIAGLLLVKQLQRTQ